MAVKTFTFDTGPSTLPDVGVLHYNGCIFSPLFVTQVSGTIVPDEANRTARYVEYNLSADGYVTLPAGQTDLSPTMANLRQLLTAHGGRLTYQGRGFDLNINVAQGGQRDVAWGPAPQLLEFQPLGGGLGAKVRWQVKVRVPEIKQGKGLLLKGTTTPIPLLQFCWDTSVGFGDDGFASISVRGVLEIPLTRSPNQTSRTPTQTADDVRSVVESVITDNIDQSRFRITRREFPISKDRRTLNFDVQAEEKPYMDLPPLCTVARGTYSVRPAKAGMSLVTWLCTLRATYTVRKDQPRRIAWIAFLALLRQRMSASAQQPKDNMTNQSRQRGIVAAAVVALPAAAVSFAQYLGILKSQNKSVADAIKPMLIDFNFDEGLYLDSKTTSFSASWRFVCPFSHILLASGLWSKVPEQDAQGENLWATSMSNVTGAQSWLKMKLDPKLDIIVDFGS